MKKFIATLTAFSAISMSVLPAMASDHHENNKITINFNETNNYNVNLTDIGGHWAEKYIKDLVKKGVLKGDDHHHFSPEASVSRAQWAAMVTRYFNLPTTTGTVTGTTTGTTGTTTGTTGTTTGTTGTTTGTTGTTTGTTGTTTGTTGTTTGTTGTTTGTTGTTTGTTGTTTGTVTGTTPAVQDFVDVKTTYWGYPYIEAAKNYFDAYRDLNGGLDFRPEVAAKRQDVTVTLVKILIKLDPSITLMDAASADTLLHDKFSDADLINPVLRPYVATAVQNNLIHGDGHGHFLPLKPLTRAQAATMLDQLLNVGIVVDGTGSSTGTTTGGTTTGTTTGTDTGSTTTTGTTTGTTSTTGTTTGTDSGSTTTTGTTTGTTN